MKTIKEGLLETITLAKSIFTEYENRTDDLDAYVALITLVRIEKILDSGRILVDPGESKQEIHKGLDEVRNDIDKLKEKLNQDRIREMLNSAGEDLKVRG